MKTSAELFDEAKALMDQANEILRQEKSSAVADIKATIAKYNISADDLGFAPFGRKQRRKHTVAYRGPAGEVWSGKGRQPQWLKAAVDAGASKEQFRI